MNKLLFLSLSTLGISSIITQLILLREFLTVFSGNELVYGLILANWFLLTGLGSYLGRSLILARNKIAVWISFQIIIAILPLLQITFIRSIPVLFFRGLSLGVDRIYYLSLLILAPYCLITGVLLTFACILFTKRNISLGKVYFFDSLGNILGGFIFSFLFVYLLNSFETAYVVLVLNLLCASLLSIKFKHRILSVLCVLITLLATFLITTGPNMRTLSHMYGEPILYAESSPYGHVVVTESRDQLNVYENGKVLFSSENLAQNEEDVHLVMLQHASPKNILLVSGGISGIVPELEKYNVSRIDYVELDPLVLQVSSRYSDEYNNPKVHAFQTDARQFIKSTEKKYDVIILNLPDPLNLQLNRYYSTEFFQEVKNALSEKGIFSLSLTGYQAYINKETGSLYSSIWQSLNVVFDNVIAVPAQQTYFIASRSNLTFDYDDLFTIKKIPTIYLTRPYLQDILKGDRLTDLTHALSETTPPNSDFKPVSYYLSVKRWADQMQTGMPIFMFIVVVLVLIFVFRLDKAGLSIFTTGITASSVLLILITLFEIEYGYVYSQIGVIITLFMIGLAVGSGIANKKPKLLQLWMCELLLSLSSLLPLVIVFGDFPSERYVIYFLSVWISGLTGSEWVFASQGTKASPEKSASLLYTADFAGAFIGALTMATLLIPLLGIVWEHK